MRDHPLMFGHAPVWASAWGEDAWGDNPIAPFVAFEVEGVEYRMRWIPPGMYFRGSSLEEGSEGYDPDAYKDESPRHEVELTEGFWLGETAVTQALWLAVMGGDNPSSFASNERPVEQVSWEDCQRFCERLSEQLPGLHARLPSEAEWEYACRAGSTDPRYGALDEIAWYQGNSDQNFELSGERGTHPVGKKRPNAWGLYDMLGNVGEWCQDATKWDAENLGLTPYEPGKQHNISTHGPARVHRGGSWFVIARFVRASSRYAYEPSTRVNRLGFRLVSGRPLMGGAVVPDKVARSR